MCLAHHKQVTNTLISIQYIQYFGCGGWSDFNTIHQAFTMLCTCLLGITVYLVSLYTFCVTARDTPSLLKCSTKGTHEIPVFNSTPLYFSAPGHVGPASPPHPTPTTHTHTHTTNTPHTPPPLRRLGGGASTSGLADLRMERRGGGRGEEEEEDEGDEEGGTYPEGPGASPEGEGLLRDGAGRRGTGDGSEGVITAASRDEVLGVLAGLATEVSRVVW